MRINNITDLKYYLDQPIQVARWMDAMTGVTIYIRGYTLAERLAWKDSAWACEKDKKGEITEFKEDLFAKSIVARLASWDMEGNNKIWDSISVGMAQLVQADEDTGMPPGVIAGLFMAAHQASGFPPDPQWNVSETSAIEDPLAKLRHAYSRNSWFSNILPLFKEVEFQVKPRTLEDYFSSSEAVRPIDKATDMDFGRPKILQSILVDERGNQLITDKELDWVCSHIPYGCVLAIEEASGKAAGFVAGELDFFSINKNDLERMSGTENSMPSVSDS